MLVFRMTAAVALGFVLVGCEEIKVRLVGLDAAETVETERYEMQIGSGEGTAS